MYLSSLFLSEHVPLGTCRCRDVETTSQQRRVPRGTVDATGYIKRLLNQQGAHKDTPFQFEVKKTTIFTTKYAL